MNPRNLAAGGLRTNSNPAHRIEHISDEETRDLAHRYCELFCLQTEPLRITTIRAVFQEWLGRRIGGAIGGAYVYQPKLKSHLILINLPRIDRRQPKAVEVVVAEEFLHMRDWVDGDRRRHAKHGYDRIAFRVAEITGASLEEIRGCLLASEKRPPKYAYRCPGCARIVMRRRRGTWSCGICSPTFDRRFILRLVAEIGPDTAG